LHINCYPAHQLLSLLQGHNSFIRKNLNFTTFSAEAGNLYNKHSYKHSGAWQQHQQGRGTPVQHLAVVAMCRAVHSLSQAAAGCFDEHVHSGGIKVAGQQESRRASTITFAVLGLSGCVALSDRWFLQHSCTDLGLLWICCCRSGQRQDR
jgi:hypothetical protein